MGEFESSALFFLLSGALRLGWVSLCCSVGVCFGVLTHTTAFTRVLLCSFFQSFSSFVEEVLVQQELVCATQVCWCVQSRVSLVFPGCVVSQLCVFCTAKVPGGSGIALRETP